MKNKSLLFILILAFNFAFAQKMQVSTKVLNVRDNPSSSSNVIGKLYENNEVEVLKIDGNWCEISFNDSKAYVNKEFLSENKRESAESEGGFKDFLKMVGGGIFCLFAIYYTFKYKKSLI